MAKLYFYYASMNAGKSTTLLQADFNYRERGMATMLWTAALDHRGGDNAIESRMACTLRRIALAPGRTSWRGYGGACRVAFACDLVDEAQFLSADQVWQAARIADEGGIRSCAMAFAHRFSG
jgi:thymidine kinase